MKLKSSRNLTSYAKETFIRILEIKQEAGKNITRQVRKGFLNETVGWQKLKGNQLEKGSILLD